MKKTALFATIVLAVMLTLTSCGDKGKVEVKDKKEVVVNCEKHGVDKKDCAFCDKSLIESKGFCKAHDVAEALCPVCAPQIIPAYKKEGDWCKTHDTPESLCKECKAE